MTNTDLSGPQRAIIAAMYHRTRKDWLEWGAAEIARRVKRSPDEISRDLRDLAAMGMVSSDIARTTNRYGFTCWQATDSGKRTVAS